MWTLRCRIPDFRWFAVTEGTVVLEEQEDRNTNEEESQRVTKKKGEEAFTCVKGP